MDWSYSEKKLISSWSHWRVDDGSERVGRRRTQLLDDMRCRRRYWELTEEVEDRKRWKRQSITIEHKEEIHIFHKSMDLLISSILNINNYNNNNIIRKLLICLPSIEKYTLQFSLNHPVLTIHILIFSFYCIGFSIFNPAILFWSLPALFHSSKNVWFNVNKWGQELEHSEVHIHTYTHSQKHIIY